MRLSASYWGRKHEPHPPQQYLPLRGRPPPARRVRRRVWRGAAARRAASLWFAQNKQNQNGAALLSAGRAAVRRDLDAGSRGGLPGDDNAVRGTKTGKAASYCDLVRLLAAAYCGLMRLAAACCGLSRRNGARERSRATAARIDGPSRLVAPCCAAAPCCALLRLVSPCCALLRLVAPCCCALLRLVAPHCALLRLVAPFCSLLRLVAACCCLLRLVAA